MKKAASEKNRYKLNNWKVVERNRRNRSYANSRNPQAGNEIAQRKSVNNETAQAEELELLWFIYEIRQMIWNSKKRSESMRRPLNDDKSGHKLYRAGQKGKMGNQEAGKLATLIMKEMK